MVKRPTLRDVANLSGTSLATVSRVLSGSEYAVSAEMRATVLAAAGKLGYMHNALGKGLKTSSTRNIGVIIPNITNPYYALLLQGIQDTAAQKGYHILLCNSNRDAVQEEQNIEMLLSKCVDGILLASISTSIHTVQRAIDIGCPVITMEQEVPIHCIHVGFDFKSGAWMATKHLIDKGHRRIGFIGAPLNRYSRHQMLAGYKQCLTTQGIEVDNALIRLTETENEGQSNYEIENGVKCARSFMEAKDMPTGVVCLNDMTAIGAMRGFLDGGYRIPEDLSIIGFDNIPFCEVCKPSLTTIDQHAYEIGDIATRLLTERIEDEDVVQYSVMLKPSLVERSSTGLLR